ncbi:MAG TPA: ERAP1-like C-terminal domain-containing protein [Thermoanaerobaculia bacterium]|nr:ERAP1-like C-terminal domain-containing protein [Thermoanaerobaculia bacterium]
MRRFGSLATLFVLAAVPAALAGPPPPRTPIPTAAPEPPKLRLPAVAAPVGYEAELRIDPAQDTFRGSISIELRLKERTSLLWLNATALEITKAHAVVSDRTVAVRPVPGGDDFAGFAFARPIGPGNVVLKIDYTGKLDRSSTQGLFREKDGEDWYAFSMFEAIDARRAFPCFDEPGFKVPWQLTLRIPPGDTAVSNTPIEAESAGADGSKVVRFKTTKPLPSYLVALGVGPFDYLDAGTAGSKNTKIRIVTPRGKASQGRYAAQTTKPLLERLEAYFGIPYPYEKLDHLAVPQAVTFGAEENAGLISWSERALIAPPAEETVAFQRRQASYSAHEMAHQWFGDLVTMQWWDDVWLNESFATWMADKMLIDWKPEWGVAVGRVVDRSDIMYNDTLVSARKIRQEIASADDIANAFDQISYAKGGAVITMFEAWIGVPKFEAGVHDYLAAHAYGNATSADFLTAIEAASRPGVAAAFSTFLDQAGVPVVEVSLDCAGGEPRLALSQKRLLPLGSKGAPAEVWQIPICSRAGLDGKGGMGCTLLTGATGAAPAPTAACPAWLLANDGEAGYYRALYEGDLLAKLLAVADTKLTEPELVGLIRDVNALAAAGAMPVADALALVPRFSSASGRQTVTATLRIASDVRDHLVPEDLHANYARFISKMFGPRARSLGFLAKSGDSEDTKLLRTELVRFVAEEGNEPELQAEAKRLALRWLDDRSAVPADMAGAVLEAAAIHGDRALFERFRDAAKAEKSRRDELRLLNALGNFEDPALVREALDFFLSPAIESREAFQMLFPIGRTEAGRQILWDFVRAHYDAVVERLPREVSGFLPLVGGSFCDPEHRREVADFFQERASKLPGGPRNLAQALEGIDLCIASRAAQEPGVREFLKGY